MTDKKNTKAGPGSFCIPRAAIRALLDHKANAYEIIAYLVLAKHTDATGKYSTAGISAVYKATGANKTFNGTLGRALERLKKIRATATNTVGTGPRAKTVTEDLGPILYDRDTWIAETGEVLPDGPVERAKVLHVLPIFDEEIYDRVWIPNALVTGVGEFLHPLKALKNAGDRAAQLLLALYSLNDMGTWGGIRPVCDAWGPWRSYEAYGEAHELAGEATLLRATSSVDIAPRSLTRPDPDEFWRAFRALKTLGFVYEVVVVLDRASTPKTSSDGSSFEQIPDDAEPLYDLDARSLHGYKPTGEEGLGGLTARTAGELGHPVAVGGQFDGTYAAIVPRGIECMIAGIYRLRFRITNPNNAGVKGAWRQIQENQRRAHRHILRVRDANHLPKLPSLEAMVDDRDAVPQL